MFIYIDLRLLYFIHSIPAVPKLFGVGTLYLLPQFMAAQLLYSVKALMEEAHFFFQIKFSVRPVRRMSLFLPTFYNGFDTNCNL